MGRFHYGTARCCKTLMRFTLSQWAIRLPGNFVNPNTAADLLNEFMGYCNIVTKPQFQQSVFS